VYVRQAGRPTDSSIGSQSVLLSIQCLKARVMFWLSSVAARDVELQRRGIVWIIWVVGDCYRPKFNDGVSRIFPAAMTRTAAIHVCFEDSNLTASINSAISILDTFSLIRLQTHFGTVLECRYNLMTFVSTHRPTIIPSRVSFRHSSCTYLLFLL